MKARPVVRRSVKSAPGMKRVPVRVWMTEFERQQLKMLASANHVSMSKYLLDSALHTSHRATPAQIMSLVEELESLRAHLGKVGSNLNQIARHANTHYEVPTDAAFTARQVYELVTKINEVISGGGVAHDA